MNEADSLEQFESELADLEFTGPSADYVRKGRGLIASRQAVSAVPYSRLISGLRWHYALLPLAAVTLLLGVLILPGADFNDGGDSLVLSEFQSDKELAHSITAAPEFERLLANSTTSAMAISPETLLEDFLMANCQSCHDPVFLAALVPTTMPGDAMELERLVKKSLSDILAETRS